MTLEELLALFPDNTTGDISAADVRTAITELFNTTAAVKATADANAAQIVTLGSNMDALFSQVQAIDARVTALENAP